VHGRDIAGGESHEEAAWRDLIAHYDAPADGEGSAPWPERESLGVLPPAEPVRDPAAETVPAPQAEPVQGPPAEAAQAPPPAEPAGDLAGEPAPGLPADPDPNPDPDPEPPASPLPGNARVIRPAGQASPAPGPADDDDHYVPPPPPPLPRLEPITKGAWAAMFGGPGYLLLATAVGWTVPGWAAFCAVAAFIGGFAVLVLRMGDEPPHDSGPDNGAVV